MTGTPNLFRVVAVLDYALEMRAHRRECFELSGCCMNQNSWLVSKLKDLSRINGDFAELCRHHRVFRRLDHLRRRHKAEDGIKDGAQRGQRGTSQQVVQKAASGRRRWPRRSEALCLPSVDVTRQCFISRKWVQAALLACGARGSVKP